MSVNTLNGSRGPKSPVSPNLSSTRHVLAEAAVYSFATTCTVVVFSLLVGVGRRGAGRSGAGRSGAERGGAETKGFRGTTGAQLRHAFTRKTKSHSLQTPSPPWLSGTEMYLTNSTLMYVTVRSARHPAPTVHCRLSGQEDIEKTLPPQGPLLGALGLCGGPLGRPLLRALWRYRRFALKAPWGVSSLEPCGANVADIDRRPAGAIWQDYNVAAGHSL